MRWGGVGGGRGGVNFVVVSVGIYINSRIKELPAELRLIANRLCINIVAVALWESLPHLQKKII